MRHDENTMERPNLVGPMGEVLMMDEDPVSEEIVYRIDNGTSSEGGVSRGVNVRRRSCIEAASKIYIRAKEHIVAFFDLHHVTMSMRYPGTMAATTDLTNAFSKYHLQGPQDPSSIQQTKGSPQKIRFKSSKSMAGFLHLHRERKQATDSLKARLGASRLPIGPCRQNHSHGWYPESPIPNPATG